MMHKTTLEQWRMFRAVSQAGGFNQASALVHKSQSSIHHSVNKLEETLGIKLFTIDGRKTVLTEAGSLMIRRAEHLLDEVSRLETIAESLSAGVESVIKIAVDGAFPQCFVFQSIERLSATFPHVKIEIIDTALSGTNELIESGDADIGLSHFKLEDCLNEEICLIEFIAVAHSEHPLHQFSRELTNEDLTSYRHIVVRDSAIKKKNNVGWAGAEQNWTVSNMRTSIELVEQGMGYAWLPYPSITATLKSGVLKKLNLKQGQKRTESFYLNFLNKRQLGLVARELLGELRSCTMDIPTSGDAKIQP